LYRETLSESKKRGTWEKGKKRWPRTTIRELGGEKASIHHERIRGMPRGFRKGGWEEFLCRTKKINVARESEEEERESEKKKRF